jgi:anti-sigma regulatory factor (Ser/Thr protein kinase)
MLTMTPWPVANDHGGEGESMSGVRSRGEAVRKFILESLEHHPRDIVRVTVEHFGITRQAAHRHLQNLVEEKAVIPDGNTRARVYRLAPLSEWKKVFKVVPGMSESQVWLEVAPHLGPLPENVRRIWQYGFTEMFNNVIDHSASPTVVVNVSKTAASTEVVIQDAGVGIFRKIQEAMGLLDERHAVLELAKGKFTTDPKNHSGEGIFFASRSFDDFQILSGKVYFSHDLADDEDWILEDEEKPLNGTSVTMRLNNHTSRTLAAVFAEYADADHGFTKTVVPVRLAQYGDDKLISRSQAKRLLVRVDRFRTVMLDFAGVETIGQGFADEVFRVFAREHPEIELMEMNAAPEVVAMISRVRNAS